MRRVNRLKSERGIGIIENLVAIVLVSIALLGSTTLFVTCFTSNAASRTYTSLVADVQATVDTYRNGAYSNLLGKFGTTYTSITNGQVATESSTSAAARSTYTTTFTAIKSNGASIPEAVKIKVAASQRRGRFSNASYEFETIIAQVN